MKSSSKDICMKTGPFYIKASFVYKVITKETNVFYCKNYKVFYLKVTAEHSLF